MHRPAEAAQRRPRGSARILSPRLRRQRLDSASSWARSASRSRPAPTPAPTCFLANETGFQHFALVVADIERGVCAALRARGWRPISLDGPERLPKASGGATAFKFRDPDGHPLELLQFAPEAVPPLWRARFVAAAGARRSTASITLRSPSATQRRARSFWASLGLTPRIVRSTVGPEQARLDGFRALSDAEVEIVSLSPPSGARPGVELLEYH